MMSRIGVMGGMFDPVHRGHIAAAVAALDTLTLDSLHLVPCARPNHRRAPSASGQHRLKMLELAADVDQRLVVDDRELHRPGVSYAVDTLRSFAAEQPDAALVFVLGWDSFLSLPDWHQWLELFELAHFCAVSRPGKTDPVPPVLQTELMTRRAESSQSLFRQKSGGIFILDGVQVDVSSTRLREALAQKPADHSLLPPAVAAYIHQHKLY